MRFGTSGTLPAGLSETTLYYVVSSTADLDTLAAGGTDTGTFKVSLTEGGSAVDITDTGSGQLNVIKQFDTAAVTLVGDGSTGQGTFTHPAEVWANPGTYELEYVVIWTSPSGKETVYERDILELRSRIG